MHLEALTSSTRRLWPHLKEFREFVLAGGTALALQIGHRISVDFDFFSRHRIDSALLERVERIFAGFNIKPVVNNPEQLTVAIDGVNLTFVVYRFPAAFPPLEFEGVYLLSIRDIAAAKAYALGRRATLKDYVDLYFIVSEKHSTLEEIVSTALKTHGEAFEPRLFLEQLVYLQDVPEESIQFLKEPVSRPVVEAFFEREVAKIKL